MDEQALDAGLEELTEDLLGPADSGDGTETQSQPPEQDQQATTEPTEPQPEPDASATAPTPTAGPDTIEIDGRTYNREQLKASLSQLPHVQRLYLEEKKRNEEYQRQQQQAQQPQAQAQSPAQVLSAMHASFGPMVKDAVESGFIEPDFAELYPNAVAGMVMYRESIRSIAELTNTMAQKIAQYERSNESQSLTHEVYNNMTALSSQHPAFAPLAQRDAQDQFFGYLRYLDPTRDQLNDPQYMAGAWVAFKRNDFLGPAEAAKQAAQARTVQRTAQRRNAVGDALTGSRPAPATEAPPTPLDEMIEDALQLRR